MGLSDGRKKFPDRFSLFDTIPECDSHPAIHVAVASRAYRAYAQVINTTITAKIYFIAQLLVLKVHPKEESCINLTV